MLKFGKFSPASRRFLQCTTYRHSSSSNPNERSHYDVLGVSKDASSGDIKKAYYEQSMQHHPDKKDGNQERFRELTSAYEVLGNVKLRKMYDKGLLPRDSSVIYEAQTPSATLDEDDAASTSKPPQDIMYSPKLDQWSRAHYSHSFVRDQERRAAAERKNLIRTRKQEKSHAQNLMVFIIIFVFVFLGYEFEKGTSAVINNAKEKEKINKKPESKS